MMRGKINYQFLSVIILTILFVQTSFPSLATDDILLEKPPQTSAILWLQQLEEKRTEAARLRRIETFNVLTKEISATIAGKYGISEREATPEEQIVIIHSIVRTRLNFVDMNSMLYDFYLNYDRSKTSSFLQADCRLKEHMAAVLAIDVMVMKAESNDDFEEKWREENDQKTVSRDFISEITSHAQAHERREVYEPLSQHFQKFLQTRHNTVHLANDVFSVFAPKIGLKQFCSEIIISGTYRGWEIHGGSDFTNVVTLADIVNSRSDLSIEIINSTRDPEGMVKSVFWSWVNDYSPESDVSIKSPSGRMAISPSDELRRSFNLKEEDMIVHYSYDPNHLLGRIGIRTHQKKTFYFSRSVKNPLIRQLLRGVVFQSPIGVTSETGSNNSTNEDEVLQTANSNNNRPAPSSARVSFETARPRSDQPTPQTPVRTHTDVPQQRSDFPGLSSVVNSDLIISLKKTSRL